MYITEMDRSTLVREVLSVLSPGISVSCSRRCSRAFETSILWFDVDLARLCIDNSYPTLTDRYINSAVPRGVYIRDISCIRIHSDSDEENQFQIIASEDAFIISLGTSNSTDWLVLRLNYLMDEIIGTEEMIHRRILQQSIDSAIKIDEDRETELEDTRRLLKLGVETIHHCNGKKILSVLRLFEMRNVFELRLVPTTPPGPLQALSDLSRMLFFGSASVPPSIRLSSVVELRKGSHTQEFVKTGSEIKESVCLSIIGAHTVYCIEFQNEPTRDLLSARLADYVRHAPHVYE